MKIILPLPAPCLQPNQKIRFHWSKRHKAAKKARGEAALLTREAKNRTWGERITLKPTFYFRDKRRRDPTNLAGWLKEYQDGIADALGVDDEFFWIERPVQLVDRQNPRVEIEVVEG